ncbi:MAG: GNAT family N-acetyltransferase [Desulfobacteraceae bacterium]
MMGKRGRFGKYGETKRLGRLRQSGIRGLRHKGPEDRSYKSNLHSKKGPYQKRRVRIRAARLTDGGFIRQLSGKVFSIYGPYKDRISQWFESGMTMTLIALVDGEPAGFVMTGRLSQDPDIAFLCELLAIAVEPEKQQMGIGQMLIKETEKKAAELGEKRLFLHTATENLAAQKLFSKSGYRPCTIKRKFYPAGQHALMMSKEIGEETGTQDEQSPIE